MNGNEQDADNILLRDMVSRIQTYHRKIHRKIIKLTPENLAYFAGIFDTEVHFNINSPHNIRLEYNKHNKDFLKIFQLSFGGQLQKLKFQDGWKSDVWEWTASSKQSYKILKQVYPFLRIRREKARLCIECYETCELLGTTKVGKTRIYNQYIKLIKECESKPTQRFAYSNLPDLKIAYLAGIFDVDASFVITRRTEPGRNTYLLEVIKRKSDYETMEFITSSFGGKIHVVTKSKLNKQKVWEIKYVSQKAYVVLKQIYPYLKAQKRIAEICIEFQDEYYRGNRGGIEISPARRRTGEIYSRLLQEHHLKWRSRFGKQTQN